MTIGYYLYTKEEVDKDIEDAKRNHPDDWWCHVAFNILELYWGRNKCKSV